jgi:hypothetical protein
MTGEATDLEIEAPAVLADLYNEFSTAYNTVTKTGALLQLSGPLRRLLGSESSDGTGTRWTQEALLSKLMDGMHMVQMMAQQLGFEWEDIEVIAQDREEHGLSSLPDPIERVKEWKEDPIPLFVPNPATIGIANTPFITTTTGTSTYTIPIPDTTYYVHTITSGASTTFTDASGQTMTFNNFPPGASVSTPLHMVRKVIW